MSGGMGGFGLIDPELLRIQCKINQMQNIINDIFEKVRKSQGEEIQEVKRSHPNASCRFTGGILSRCPTTKG